MKIRFVNGNLQTNCLMKKIREIFNVFFKKEEKADPDNFDDIESIVNSLIYGPFSKMKKCLIDILNNIKENVIQRLNNYQSIKDESQNKKDRLFLLILSKCYSHFFSEYENFISILKAEYFDIINNESINTTINKFFSEVSKSIKNEMMKTIQQFLDISLSHSVNQIDVDSFISVCNKMLEVCQGLFDQFSIDSTCLISKYENEFVFQFFETKFENIKEILEKEDWNPIQAFPNKIQKLVINILNHNYIELKFKDREYLMKILNLEIDNITNKINDVNTTNDSNSTNIISSSTQQINVNPIENLSNKISGSVSPLLPNLNCTIDLNGSKFKMTNSCLELIKFILETIKIISYFDISLSETVIYQFVKIVRFYLQNCKEIIIQGEGVKKGKLKSISQKEISLLCANVSILEIFILQLIKNLSCEMMADKQEIIIPSLNDLLNIAKKVHLNCKEKINELFQSTIEISLQELSKLDFSKYPVLEKKEYNAYCTRFKSFKTLYNHMLNGFEKEEMKLIFDENLKIYFEKLEKSLMNFINSTKMENDASYKQLKSDLIFFKKTLKSFEILNINMHKEKVDQIINSILPPKYLKKKKSSNIKNVVLSEE